MNKNIKIGVFSSSSNLGFRFPVRVQRAKNILEKNGYFVTLGNLWNKSIGYSSGTFLERANEFNSLIENNDILMSMIGGYNSSSILEYIDYDKIIKFKPKIVGFSDTTALLLAIYQKTKIPVYYGPSLLVSFDEQEYIQQYNLKSLKDIIVDDKKEMTNPKFWTDQKIWWTNDVNGYSEIKQLHQNKLESINDGIVQGRLIGGNLNTIMAIYGTEYMPTITENDILFIEDSYKNADECEREFSFLKNTKILDKIKAVIIGKIEGFDSLGSNETYESLFLKFLERKIPVLMHYDCSHTLPMNILKIGASIELNTFLKTIKYLD